MDGENNGKPYEQMDDLGGKPTIFGNTQGELLWKKGASSERVMAALRGDLRHFFKDEDWEWHPPVF